ncbi:MAG: hypothetical protein V2A76_17440, partial [Planctomycetota bacterium]
AFRDGRFSVALEQYERLLHSEEDCAPRRRFRSAVQAALCVSRLGRHEEGAQRFEALYDSFEAEMGEPDAYKHAVAMMVQLDLSGADPRQLAAFAESVGVRHEEQRKKLADFAETIRGTGLLRRFRSWKPIIRRIHAEAGGRQMLELLVHYLLVAAREEVDITEMQDVLSNAIGPESEELIMNTGEKLIQKGKEAGVKQGMKQGMREALASVVRTRFGEIPEDLQAQMDAADLVGLQRYLDRVSNAHSVHEIFAD